ncbi:hypothetical protein [Streptomyces sp. V4I2]|uniref:hypothetical protein n=1 Tax=Streptomyces sp. V4I2 TaxID=3042280 RepID=UPI00277ED0EB|nr:hypothetical protein [Streptomyces sp. V4I2]MDQ1051868.1 hypothetical protein [Streptomyces sp. V4I2]
MTPFAPSRAQRLAIAASALTMIAVAVAVGVLVLAIAPSLPETWWPRTGDAFAAHSPSDSEDPCVLVVGPAKVYCERDHHAPAASSTPDRGNAAAWMLMPAATAVGALVIWRRRTPAGQGRY